MLLQGEGAGGREGNTEGEGERWKEVGMKERVAVFLGSTPNRHVVKIVLQWDCIGGHHSTVCATPGSPLTLSGGHKNATAS